jgi:hypothetical protein
MPNRNQHLPKWKAQNKPMKKSILSVGVIVAGVVLLANNAMAGAGPVNVPDGGSSALLIAISMSALALGRKLLR